MADLKNVQPLNDFDWDAFEKARSMKIKSKLFPNTSREWLL